MRIREDECMRIITFMDWVFDAGSRVQIGGPRVVVAEYTVHCHCEEPATCGRRGNPISAIDEL